MVLVVFLVVLGVVWVVLGVVLEQVEAVAKPLLVPVLKKPPPGPPKPPPGPPKTPPGPIYDFNRKISRNHKIVFFLVFCYFSWDYLRLLGHPWSDLHETGWKLIPGVSRSFLNSSGTKITAQNNQKRQTTKTKDNPTTRKNTIL